MKVGCNDLANFLEDVRVWSLLFWIRRLQCFRCVFSLFVWIPKFFRKSVNDFKWLFRNVEEKKIPNLTAQNVLYSTGSYPRAKIFLPCSFKKLLFSFEHFQKIYVFILRLS